MTQEIKQVDITIEAGADFQMLFIVRDESGNLVNLTGSTVEAQLREYAEASDYLQFTATHNGSGGKVSISMPHEDTAVIPYTAGVYDVYITDTNNIREKYLTGDVTVIPSVTKPVAGEIIYLLSFSSEDDFPTTGIVRRIYFSHASNKMYRWNGTNYVSIVTDGEAATVEIGTVTTLDAGSDATVTNSGSEYNAVFNFGIPKGDAGTTSWEGITDKPETFTPSAHTHDDRYYTENEVDTALSGKSDTGHTHDDRYYTENETDTLLSAKADTSTVNSALASKADASSVYTKGQVDTLVGGKVSTTSVGSLAYQNSVDYTTEVTNKPTLGDLASQNTISYESTYITNKPTLGTMSAESASDYYTKTETDTLLSAKADSADLGTMSAEDASDYYDKTATDALLSEKADIIHTSASGSLVHITDGAAYPVDSLTVDIDPVQDLHGYDAPWPAGGGKNLLNVTGATETINDVKFTVDKDVDGNVISITANGTASANADFYFVGANGVYESTGLPSGSYTATGNTLAGTVSVLYVIEEGGNIKAQVYSTHQSDTFTLDDTKGYRIFIRVYNGETITNQKYYPMIRLSSVSDATFAPYSNVCPISGHSSAVVTRTGKNLLPESTVSIGNPNPRTYSVRFDSTPLPVGTYSITYTKDYQIGNLQVVYTDGSALTIGNNNTFTATKPFNRIFFYMNQADYNDGKVVTFSNIQLELYSTPSAYEPYSGTSVTIALGSTYYGAQLDAVTGTLTVTHGIIDINSFTATMGSTTNAKGLHWEDYFYATNKLVNGTAISSMVPRKDGNTGWASSVPCFSISENNANVIRVYCFESSLADFKTAYADLKIVYPLATPTVITGLTPATMSALMGENNVWADTGDVSVGYRADTKRYIDKVLSDAVAQLQALILDN